MKVVARRRQGYVHEVEIESGHTIVIDEPANVPGGTDAGPSPTRLVAAALAGCAAITVEMYAARKGWDVGPVEVGVEVGYDDFTPRAFEVTLRLAPGLSDEQKERLTAIARKCPVHKLLSDETPVSVSSRVEGLTNA